MNLISKSSAVGTYKFVSTVEISVEGFHVTNGKSLGAASILYLSLLLMMSSSRKLISAIFLDRLCQNAYLRSESSENANNGLAPTWIPSKERKTYSIKIMQKFWKLPMSEVTSQRGAFCQYGSLLVPNYLFSKEVVERSCDENLV